MIRNSLEMYTGKLSNEDYNTVSQMAKEDIIFNRIGFKKLTSKAVTVRILRQCVTAIERCK